jgi:hypothetical protein
MFEDALFDTLRRLEQKEADETQQLLTQLIQFQQEKEEFEEEQDAFEVEMVVKS